MRQEEFTKNSTTFLQVMLIKKKYIKERIVLGTSPDLTHRTSERSYALVTPM
jgi:hypothetical protein